VNLLHSQPRLILQDRESRAESRKTQKQASTAAGGERSTIGLLARGRR
jgi:hypothetical protein